MQPSMLARLRCPLCQQSLQSRDNSLICPQGHCFDQARQGYYNLLPVQQKRSKQPGDDKQMVSGRHFFLEQGHYQPFSDALNQLASQYLPDQNALIVDAGCGEGYYSERLYRHLQTQHGGINMAGIDISKAAILQASRRSRELDWLVASAAKAPIADQAVDLLLCLFTPLSASEFLRLLKPEGHLITASAGADHLLQLRQIIYPQLQQKSRPVTTPLLQHFQLIDSQDLRFQFSLNDNQSIQQLLLMTPHHWRIDQSARQRIEQLSQLTLNADIQLQVFQPKSAG